MTTVLDTSAGRPRTAADDLNDPSDATYQRWRQQRQREADQARRLIERERERPRPRMCATGSVGTEHNHATAGGNCVEPPAVA